MEGNEFDTVEEVKSKRGRKSTVISLTEKADSALLQATAALKAIRGLRAKEQEVLEVITPAARKLVEADLA